MKKIARQDFSPTDKNEYRPVTSDSPMLRDSTIYKLYLIKESEKSTIEEIRATSRMCGFNYIEASKRLKEEQQFLLAQGDAYEMRDALKIISLYDVCYKVVPPYPHTEELYGK